MKVVLACVFFAVGVVAQQETVLQETKTATRVLPADVLRDQPGLCFGSTTCGLYTVGTTWELVAFCGRATCMKNATGLFEQVEDCGPAPKPNDQCTPSFAEPGTPFPDCCPKYRCLPGVTLEFPTPEEIQIEVAKAREAQALALAEAEKNAAAGAQPAAQA